jgi:hypothetical protein
VEFSFTIRRMRARTSASSLACQGSLASTEAPEQTKASTIPSDHGFRFDDNQDVAPFRPKTAEQSPEYSILDSQPRVRPVFA